MPQNHRSQKIKVRLFCYREKRVLTAQGWTVSLISLTALLLGILVNIHPFLAVTSPLRAEALVVEGWLNDQGVEKAVSEFKIGGYKTLITTGGALSRGSYLAQYKTYAALSAATLVKLGFNSNQLVVVPAKDVIRDRTYANALALSQWLTDSKSTLKSINLYTDGVHARRSRLLYQKALAPVKVGIVAVTNLDYDPRHWWASSAGVKAVVSEAISYLYAQLFSALD